jgi:invasion protein IalB
MGERAGAACPPGWLAAGAALLLAATAGCATERAAQAMRMPGTPVQDTFRGREVVALWNDTDVNAGSARPAYIYTPDHRYALVANGPEQDALALDPLHGAWEITCPVVGTTVRCLLTMLGDERSAGARDAAVEVRFAPQGAGTTLCVGPPDATRAALRVGEHGVWRAAGVDGCFPPGASGPLLAALKADEQVGYRYTRTAGGQVAGWRPSYGFGEALDLMQWMYTRAARG